MLIIHYVDNAFLCIHLSSVTRECWTLQKLDPWTWDRRPKGLGTYRLKGMRTGDLRTRDPRSRSLECCVALQLLCLKSLLYYMQGSWGQTSHAMDWLTTQADFVASHVQVWLCKTHYSELEDIVWNSIVCCKYIFGVHSNNATQPSEFRALKSSVLGSTVSCHQIPRSGAYSVPGCCTALVVNLVAMQNSSYIQSLYVTWERCPFSPFPPSIT